MPSATVEDYVKAIYLLQQESPTGEATVVRLAATLGVTKGTVTSMVRKLRDAGLADAERYAGITLKPEGRTLAVDMLRRHRLIEVFLVETLGFDWSEVHEEAERLEHALSAKVIDRLDRFLGRPSLDPHGDPIPDATGKIPKHRSTPLAEFEPGDRGTVSRVVDQDAEFLEFVADSGLRPGTAFVVTERTNAAESLTVKPRRGSPSVFAFVVAEKILADRE